MLRKKSMPGASLRITLVGTTTGAMNVRTRKKLCRSERRFPQCSQRANCWARLSVWPTSLSWERSRKPTAPRTSGLLLSEGGPWRLGFDWEKPESNPRQRTTQNKTTAAFVLISRLQGERAAFLVRPTQREGQRSAAVLLVFQTCQLSERDAGIQLELPRPDRSCGDTR